MFSSADGKLQQPGLAQTSANVLMHDTAKFMFLSSEVNSNDVELARFTLN